jgi:hypothetical protein
MPTTPPLSVRVHRAPLCRTWEALRQGRITLGFIGGSITDPRPGYTWPEPVIAWFVGTFPRARVRVENAAIGATGSELAVFRAQRDLIARGCDIVFIDYAVNDGGEPPEKRERTREGLLRKLLAGQGRDVVLAHTFCQDHYAPFLAGRQPASIADFEKLAEHYAIGSVGMGLHALREVQRGLLRWEEWLPDGLHPQHRGSLSYAQAVIGFLEAERRRRRPGGARRPLPPPLNPRNWEHARVLPFSKVRLQGPWTVRRASRLVWMDEILSTAAPGARLAFEFRGRGLSLGFDFGKTSAEFRWRLDGGAWQDSKRDRPDWCGPDGWYRVSSVADDLTPGRHAFELEVVHGNAAGCTGTNFQLALIGVVA